MTASLVVRCFNEVEGLLRPEQESSSVVPALSARAGVDVVSVGDVSGDDTATQLASLANRWSPCRAMARVVTHAVRQRPGAGPMLDRAVPVRRVHSDVSTFRAARRDERTTAGFDEMARTAESHLGVPIQLVALRLRGNARIVRGRTPVLASAHRVSGSRAMQPPEGVR
jgi:hypothetical protein